MKVQLYYFNLGSLVVAWGAALWIRSCPSLGRSEGCVDPSTCAPVSRGLVGRPSCDAVAASRTRAVAVLSRAAGEAARTLVGRGLCGPAVPRERDANSSRTA